MKSSRVFAVLGAILVASSARLQAANLKCPSFISDHMVLQQNEGNPISGWADPGEEIRVYFDGDLSKTKADTDGAWQVMVNPGPSSSEGRPLLVETDSGFIAFDDVVVGELWLCSGQSNMSWTVQGSDRFDDVKADADQPSIRMFTVALTSVPEPLQDVRGSWVVCSPQTVGAFSAVAYHFGVALEDALDVPIGLVNSSWGGSRIEPWMRRSALEQNGDCGTASLAMWEAFAAELQEKHMAYAAQTINETEWLSGEVPGHVNAFGVDDSVDGVFWHRIHVSIPSAFADKDLVVSLGQVDDDDVTFFNGVEIGRTEGWQRDRVYDIPGGLVRAGQSVIAVRCRDGAGPGGFVGPADKLFLHPKGAPENRISLAGPAKLKIASTARAMAAQHRPMHLYNGMIHPLRAMPFAGVIWYQGESNAINPGDPDCYESLMSNWIDDWRALFDDDDLPFGMVQLAAFQHAPTWDFARARDAQRRVAQADPRVGIAVTTDIGAANDIHPRNKHDVGARLGDWALGSIYELEDTRPMSPMVNGARSRGGSSVLVSFDVFGSRLLPPANGAALGGFEVAGSDGVYHPTPARVLGRQTVRLAPKDIGEVVTIRYAWAGNPTDANLFNAENIPASPFEIAINEQARPAPGAVRGGDDEDEYEPGVTMRLFHVGRRFDHVLEPIPGITPNVDERRSTINWPNGKDFAGFQDHFVVEVTGYIKVETPGRYAFRLGSDDGSMLRIGGRDLIWIRGLHPVIKQEGIIKLDAGLHPFQVLFFENEGDAALTLEWKTPAASSFEIIPENALRTEANVTRVIAPGLKPMDDGRGVVVPGDGIPLANLHPSWRIETLHDSDFNPMVGCMCFLPDGRLLIGTFEPKNNGVWLKEPNGTLYVLDGWDNGDPSAVDVKVFADGVYHPLGLCEVDGSIYLAQRDEITRFFDADGDGNFEGRETFAKGWASDNYHHFTFGLKHYDGSLYAALSTTIGSPVKIDRGKVRGLNGPGPANRGALMKISLDDGEITYVCGGFRTPNGLLVDDDGNVFVGENQGAWMPSSKINHARAGRFYGHFNERDVWTSMYPDGGVPALNSDQPVERPAVWLPQNEAANSPTSMVQIPDGPFAGQLLMGEVKLGGIRRIAMEEVNGEFQGAVFRYSQGFEGGINRLEWAPDGSLIVGCIGEQATWSWNGTRTGLQRMVPTGEDAFEFHSISAERDGFTVRFTEPVDPEQLADPDRWTMRQWTYHATPGYGGPKVDQESLFVASAQPARDGKSVRLYVPDLKSNRVVWMRAGLQSASGQAIHSPDAWYTLNNIPGEVVQTPERKTLLVFSKTAGFRHGSIPSGITCFGELAKSLGLTFQSSEDATVFNDSALAKCAVVVFLNTTGDILNLAEEAALERWVKAGGGWLGVHAAADTEYDWPFYGELVGAYFSGHPRVQPADVKIEDADHPSTRMLPGLWRRSDEWYRYRASPRPNVRVLASLDEESYSGGGMNGDHPIAWCQDIGEGRSFYTGGGHTNESYTEPQFVAHLRGAIDWCSKAKSTPTKSAQP